MYRSWLITSLVFLDACPSLSLTSSEDLSCIMFFVFFSPSSLCHCSASLSLISESDHSSANLILLTTSLLLRLIESVLNTAAVISVY